MYNKKKLFMNWKKVLVILLGIILIVGGIFCLFRPFETFLSTGYVVGVLILCDAVANIVAWFDVKKYVNISGWYLFGAIVSAIFGIAVIVSMKMQLALDLVIVSMVIAWVIFLAISRIVLALRIKKFNDLLPDTFKNSRWISIILSSILMIVFAVICIVRPAVMPLVLGVLIAWTIIFNGVGLITIASYMSNISQANSNN